MFQIFTHLTIYLLVYKLSKQNAFLSELVLGLWFLTLLSAIFQLYRGDLYYW